ncbi:MAG: hypothetical protein JNJ44_07190 [Zoogloeaceae bacterium]|nr:hypothetical protein [Zoogloeaceae bacterium]
MGSIFLVFALLAIAVWLFLRARNGVRQQQVEAAGREKAFLAELAVPAAEAPHVPRSVGGLPRVPNGTPKSVNGAAGGGPYLSGNSAKVFRLLKLACPGHEVFPGSSLQKILGTAAPGKDLPLDFVVCAADFMPVAVVDQVRADDLPPVIALKKECLGAAGVRYARWDVVDLPSPAEAKAILVGQPS